MKIQGINFKQYSHLSFLGMYPSYDITITLCILVTAKPRLDMS